MIKLTMNVWDFKRVMREMDTYANTFTDEGLELLFDYLEDLDGDVEMDTIAICCEWTEYDNIEAAEKDYLLDDEDLEDNTTVLKGDTDIVVVRDY
jgi:hypothetical protein